MYTTYTCSRHWLWSFIHLGCGCTSLLHSLYSVSPVHHLLVHQVTKGNIIFHHFDIKRQTRTMLHIYRRGVEIGTIILQTGIHRLIGINSDTQRRDDGEDNVEEWQRNSGGPLRQKIARGPLCHLWEETCLRSVCLFVFFLCISVFVGSELHDFNSFGLSMKKTDANASA